jgi:hypothetical protein
MTWMKLCPRPVAALTALREEDSFGYSLLLSVSSVLLPGVDVGMTQEEVLQAMYELINGGFLTVQMRRRKKQIDLRWQMVGHPWNSGTVILQEASVQ